MGNASLRAAIAGGVLLACVTGARSQPLTINTLAGYPGQSYAEGAGSNSRFSNPSGAALDSAGNVYIADTDNHTIRKITTGGVSGEGPASLRCEYGGSPMRHGLQERSDPLLVRRQFHASCEFVASVSGSGPVLVWGRSHVDRTRL